MFYDKFVNVNKNKELINMQVYQIRIKELRQDHDLTQKEVAEYLGIEQTVYSRYERGINDMKIENLVKLCKLYKVSSDYVLGLPKNMKWYR